MSVKEIENLEKMPVDARKTVILLYGARAYRFDGRIYVSKHSADYFREFGRNGRKIVIFAAEWPSGIGARGETLSENFRVILFRSTWCGLITVSPRILSEIRGANVLLFLPQGSRLFYMFQFLRRFSSRLAVYLADDPIRFAGKMRMSILPGVDWIYLKAIGYILRNADVLIVRGRALERYGRKFNSCVEMTVPMVSFASSYAFKDQRSPIDPDRMRIVFFGRLSRTKGLDILFSAIARLRRENQGMKAELRIYGDGKDRELVQRQAYIEGLTDWVYFMGWVDDPVRKAEAFQWANFHIVPSVFSEGVPRCIEEAIYYRTPTIASAIGGIPEEFDAGEVVLVEPGNPVVLAEAIRKLSRDPAAVDKVLAASEKRRAVLAKVGAAGEQHARILCQE